VTQCQATMRQDGEVVAVALASFGRHRESALTVAPSHPAPDLGAPDAVEAFPYIEGMTPEFYRFLELRQIGGALPYGGADTSGLTGWCALREQPERFREEHLVAIADAWPPAPLQMLSGFAPASSLTWTLELVAEVNAGTVAPEGRFAYEVATDAARDGYAHTHAMLWRPDGALVSISRQSRSVFGGPAFALRGGRLHLAAGSEGRIVACGRRISRRRGSSDDADRRGSARRSGRLTASGPSRNPADRGLHAGSPRCSDPDGRPAG